MEDENRERKSKSGGIEGMRKSQRVGWACQLVDILNGKLPRPSLQSAATVRGAREKGRQKESLHVYIMLVNFRQGKGSFKINMLRCTRSGNFYMKGVKKKVPGLQVFVTFCISDRCVYYFAVSLILHKYLLQRTFAE
ncbi:hypothetical protein PUN28_011071 [Cardiocondyla obscurior]|uniref:Uncharacterized protein n=1 Tax=Cardiocondyla obscurior TaxID=286306 RepID=A0AAW2FPV4_9HYME